jgi:hypothetical protein
VAEEKKIVDEGEEKSGLKKQKSNFFINLS